MRAPEHVGAPVSSTPPAGWYPDTTTPGQQRWWDGTRWSDHVAPLAPTGGPQGPLPQLASFGQRLGATIIDGLVISLPAIVLVVGMVFLFAVAAGTSLDSGDPAASSGVAFAGLGLFGVFFLVAMIAPLLYGVGFEGSPHGQTIGKWVTGIRVVDGATAGRLPVGRAFARVLVRSFASGAVFALGYLWMLWDEQSRTWHDLAADSRVVVATGPKPRFGELVRSWTLRG